MTRRSEMMMAAGVVMAVGVMGALAGCGDDPDAVRGSGTIETETREVSGFREISLEGSGDVVVDVGDSETLTVEADDNLLPLITTEVRGSRLVIEHEGSISPTRNIVYQVGAIEFDGVSIAGSANVVAPNVDCDTFSVSVAGSGTFDVDGACDALDVDIAGSGDVDAEGLLVSRAEVSIAGSGDVIVAATDELRVSIAGSGDVVYIGDPSTDIDIEGSGDVRQGP